MFDISALHSVVSTLPQDIPLFDAHQNNVEKSHRWMRNKDTDG